MTWGGQIKLLTMNLNYQLDHSVSHFPTYTIAFTQLMKQDIDKMNLGPWELMRQKYFVTN